MWLSANALTQGRPSLRRSRPGLYSQTPSGFSESASLSRGERPPLRWFWGLRASFEIRRGAVFVKKAASGSEKIVEKKMRKAIDTHQNRHYFDV